MLSSIHPLGERARNNRWLVTVAAFTIGAAVAGALVGSALGWLGGLLLPGLDETMGFAIIGVTALLAGLLDVFGVPVPGPKRQVNEHWIGTYRGWVYGGAFGFELGAGLMTYVVTWSVYALLAAEFVLGSPLTGALVGAVFGLGRSLALFMAGSIDRASRLTAFHARMARLGPPVRNFAGYTVVALGALSIAGGLL